MPLTRCYTMLLSRRIIQFSIKVAAIVSAQRTASGVKLLALSGILYSLAGCGGDTASSNTTPITVTPTPTPTTTSTATVLCPFSGSYQGTYSTSGSLTSTWSWACSSTARSLIANGLPNHTVGTFPNTGNPNTITAQNIRFSGTLTPA